MSETIKDMYIEKKIKEEYGNELDKVKLEIVNGLNLQKEDLTNILIKHCKNKNYVKVNYIVDELDRIEKLIKDVDDDIINSNILEQRDKYTSQAILYLTELFKYYKLITFGDKGRFLMGTFTTKVAIAGELELNLEAETITLTKIDKNEGEVVYDLLDTLEYFQGKDVSITITENKKIKSVE